MVSLDIARPSPTTITHHTHHHNHTLCHFHHHHFIALDTTTHTCISITPLLPPAAARPPSILYRNPEVPKLSTTTTLSLSRSTVRSFSGHTIIDTPAPAYLSSIYPLPLLEKYNVIVVAVVAATATSSSSTKTTNCHPRFRIAILSLDRTSTAGTTRIL